MSLRSLLRWHYFSLQTNEGIALGEGGALQRKNGWVTIQSNLNGNLQATMVSTSKGRDDVVIKYGLREFEVYYTLYHNYSTILPVDTRHNILTNKNPKLQVDDQNEENLRVFEVIGHREPVSLRERGLTLFEIYLREITRRTV